MNRYIILGVIAYVCLVAIIHLFTGNVQLVVTGVGAGTFLLAIAALLTVAVKIREYMDKTNKLEAQLNGGLKAAAKSHLQDNEMFSSLMVRVARIEAERDDCQAALSDLRLWVVDRLDDTGNGRNSKR